MGDITERYQSHLRESAVMAARERDLIEEINIKATEMEGYHNLMQNLM